MKRMLFLLTVLLFTASTLHAQSGIQQLADKAAFETAITNNEKVVVVFAAEWCDYCKAYLPQVEGIIKDYNYKGIKFFKIYYDENVAFFKAEGITTVPTTKLYKNGKKATEMVVLKAESLQEKLQDF